MIYSSDSSNSKFVYFASYLLNLSASFRPFPVMDKPLSQEDIQAMESQLKNCVQEDRKYWRVNDVKCDAIHTAKTYEEFADRVAAAHLSPLDKADFKKKAKLSWNQYASNDKNYKE